MALNKEILTIGFAAPKGGVGKSTFSVIAASHFHYQTDNHVILLDCDFPQYSIDNMRKRDLELINNSEYYKQLAFMQFTRINKKTYPVICSDAVHSNAVLQDFLKNNEQQNYNMLFVDLPGTINANGVIETIARMDYIFIPIVADYIVLESCLKFANIVHDNLLHKENSRLKGIFLFWNMVNNSEKTDIYDNYGEIIKDLDLPLLHTRIPDLIRFKKEILTSRQTVFRSTVFPVSPKLITDSNLDVLISEIRQIIKL